MLAEITVVPVGSGKHLAEPIAHVVEVVRQSGLAHEVTALGTVVQGDDDAVWALLRRCHEAALSESGRVVTDIRLDAERGRSVDLDHGKRRVDEVLVGADPGVTS